MVKHLLDLWMVKHLLQYVLNPAHSLDKVFHALSDPTRRAVVERLGRGPASVSEVAGPLAISLTAVLQHLQVLEQSGIVRTEKRGRIRMCRLDPDALSGAEAWFAERRALWDRRIDQLEEFLAEQQRELRAQREQKEPQEQKELQGAKERKREP